MKIRNGFLALSGTMLLSVTAPAFAADVIAEPDLGPFSAQIDAWAGGLFITDAKDNTDPDENNLFAYGADARLRFDLLDVISVQADASFDDTDKNSGDDYYQGGWQVGGHLNWNNSDSGLLGISSRFAASCK